jgi:hypothetical protein
MVEGVVAEVRGNGEDVEAALIEIFGAIVDEDSVTTLDGEVCSPKEAVGVPAVLGEEAVDEVVHAELLGSALGVCVAPSAPEDEVVAFGGQLLEDVPGARPQ